MRAVYNNDRSLVIVADEFPLSNACRKDKFVEMRALGMAEYSWASRKREQDVLSKVR